MQLERRMYYISFLVIGILFLLVGLALGELDILDQVNSSFIQEDGIDDWYQFLLPWVGNPDEGGLPVPW